MDNLRAKYQAVIGLEVHAQLSTKTKIFCGCSTEFGALPNSNVCPICMGHPGILPVLNEKSVEYIVMMGLATNCVINLSSSFARKNYFYPDLPKGYQISQFETPFCQNGFLEITLPSGSSKNVGIKRIHLEEDAGKLLHGSGGNSFVDLNRCGVPLIEIVSEPELTSGEEAYIYLNRIKQIVKYLEICDGNMEKGSIRCDANVSVRLAGNEKLGIKTELKNMNSFRNVEKAVEFEIARQMDIIEDGGSISQETLLWDADTEQIFSMRSKEESHDYRYFPEPDLVPVNIQLRQLEKIKLNLPELPDYKKQKYVTEYNLPAYDAELLTSEREIAGYFEEVIRFTSDTKAASNWIMGEVLAYLRDTKTEITSFPVPAQNLAELINKINEGEINNKIGRDILPLMISEGKKASDIISEKGLTQVTDTDALSRVIDDILAESKKEINEFIAGKDKITGFFIGRIMRATAGKANPAIVNKILKEKLELLKSQKLEE